MSELSPSTPQTDAETDGLLAPMSTAGIRLKAGRKRGQRAWAGLIELLSSMRFAVALLAVICVASIIGTVIEQERPELNYINQFGPFWAEVFMRCDLHTVYSSWWFLLMLGFLVVSTSLCIARNTPKILRHLHEHKEDLRLSSFRAFSPKHKAEASYVGAAEPRARVLGEQLLREGWRVKLQTRADGTMLAAKAGHWNKLGYIATHAAIVLICLGGLLDGDLFTKVQLWSGHKTLFEGDGLVADVPQQHRLSPGNPSYRVNLLVSEGSSNSSAVLYQSQGALVQDLPFAIELKKFIVEYYSTGMPKVFASEVLIHDKATGEVTPAKIEVNKPYNHHGTHIYQSSFEDGGSRLTLASYSLNPAQAQGSLQGQVGQSQALSLMGQPYQVEWTDLRTINVENFGDLEQAAASRERVDVRRVDLQGKLHAQLGAANKDKENASLRNIGPSVQYKLRDAAGQAIEFDNYMLPVEMPGEEVPQFMFGMRRSNAEEFRYLRLPVDEEGGLGDFLRLRQALFQPDRLNQAAHAYAQEAVAADAGGSAEARRALVAQLQEASAHTLERFAGQRLSEQERASLPELEQAGLPAIARHLEANVPEAQRDEASGYVMRMLLGSVEQLLAQERQAAGLPALQAGAERSTYAMAQLMALNDAFAWPVPVIFGLTDFEQVQASVFQLTKGPGKWVVYFGCVLLIVGVLAMLYIREQRLWLWLGDDGQLRMAYSNNRPGLDSDRAFAESRDALLAASRAQDAQEEGRA